MTRGELDAGDPYVVVRGRVDVPSVLLNTVFASDRVGYSAALIDFKWNSSNSRNSNIDKFDYSINSMR